MSCRTYRTAYGSGAGLCTKMWSPRFYSYSTDAAQCVSLGPSLKGTCFAGRPNPAPVNSTCRDVQSEPSTRADGATSCAAPAAAGVDVGVIVGPIVGGVALIGAAVGAFFYCRRGGK